MEYMAGGSVADLLQAGPPLDEMSIACILRDLLHAIEYLHSEGKIHRDIKGLTSPPFPFSYLDVSLENMQLFGATTNPIAIELFWNEPSLKLCLL